MLKALHKRMQDDKGFTLIELMVVVLIIAILIAIAIPTFLGLRRRAQDRAAQSDLRNALTAAKAVYTDSESYTPFTETEAENTEPGIDFSTALNETTVDIQVASGQEIVLQTLSESGSSFCIAEDTNTPTVRGRSDAGAAFADYTACNGAVDW
jgi:type IV pilus assembly protein PilA